MLESKENVFCATGQKDNFLFAWIVDNYSKSLFGTLTIRELGLQALSIAAEWVGVAVTAAGFGDHSIRRLST